MAEPWISSRELPCTAWKSSWILEIIWTRLSNATRDHREDHKRESIKDLIVSGFDSSEGEHQIGGLLHTSS